jgi:hypothetical protein
MEGFVAEETDGMLRGSAKGQQTSRLMVSQIIFVDGVFILRARRLVLRRCMHTSEVLREEIFAVEVVIINNLIVFGVSGWWT